jgi:antitoxin ParD1/3/4
MTSASGVVRDALRSLEERKAKLSALRAHLGEGATQAQAEEFANQPLVEMLSEFRES